MRLKNPSVEELEEKKKRIESKINSLEQKLRTLLLNSKSKRPFDISLREYVEGARAKGVPLNHQERDGLYRAFADDDVSFAKDYLKPYLNLETQRQEIVKKLDDLRLEQKAVAPSQEGNANMFRKEGDRFTVRYDGGKTFYLNNLNGCHYITRLLEEPYCEVASILLVADLKRASVDSDAVGSQKQDSIDLDSSPWGAVDVAFDKTTKRTVKAGIKTLEVEADHCTDPLEAVSKREEIEKLREYLRLGSGPLGKTRKTKSSLENARTNVKNRISAVLKRIAQEDSSLHKHLSSSIKTGGFCSYRPETPIRWEL